MKITDFDLMDVVEFSMNILPPMNGIIVEIDGKLLKVMCLNGVIYPIHYGEVIKIIAKKGIVL